MPNGLAIAGGVSFPILAPDGTAGAPSYSFQSDPDCGMYLYTANQVAIAAQGAGYLRVGQGFVEVSGRLDFATTIANPLVTLVPDAANVLAQRNSTNAQTFRVYNTYTDASNYERAFLGFTSNVLWLATDNAGTGTARSMVLRGSGITFRNLAGGGDAWAMTSTGHFVSTVTNTYDIGASGGVTCPRSIYAGTSFIAANGVAATPSYTFAGDTTSGIFLGGAGYFRFASSGVTVATVGAGLTFSLVTGTVFSWNTDTSLARLAAASLRLGAAPGPTPIAQTFTIGEASRPGTDTNVGGANGTIRSGLGTGTGTLSNLIFQTPVLAASGSTAQTYATRMTVTGNDLLVTPLNGSGLTGNAEYLIRNASNAGIASISGGSGADALALVSAGVGVAVVVPTGVYIGSAMSWGWASATNPTGVNPDTALFRLAAASLRLGLAPSATPIAQTFTIGEFSRVGTDNNVAGSDGTIRSGSGTGNAAGSSLFFDTPTVGASGTVQQSYGHRLTLSALGATFDIPDQGLRINNQVNGAGASAGTLTNAPSAGNPNFWLPISIAGTTRYFPGW